MWEKCYYSEMHLTPRGTGILILNSGRKVQKFLPCWFVVLKLFNSGYCSSNFLWIRSDFYSRCWFVWCNRILSMIAFVLEQNTTLRFFCCILYRFGFHQPPLNSVNHLHLHCFALPYTPRYESFWLLYECLSFLSWMLREYLQMPFYHFTSLSRWRYMKYLSLGPIGFIEAEKFLEKIKPVPGVHSKV